jgi:hypothetical protein
VILPSHHLIISKLSSDKVDIVSQTFKIKGIFASNLIVFESLSIFAHPVFNIALESKFFAVLFRKKNHKIVTRIDITIIINLFFIFFIISIL